MAKILIIEDEEVLNRMYKQLLENHGYTVTMALNGLEGFNIAIQDHPDLIMLDIRMPKMDGMIMLKYLRQDVWGSNVPVIILTNLDTNDQILQRVIVDHPAYYLIKSNIEHDQILEKIKSILESPSAS